MGRFFKRKKQAESVGEQVLEQPEPIAKENEPIAKENEPIAKDEPKIEEVVEAKSESEVKSQDTEQSKEIEENEDRVSISTSELKSKLEEIRKVLPPCSSSCGTIVLTPAKHAKSIEEAGKMFLEMLKK